MHASFDLSPLVSTYVMSWPSRAGRGTITLLHEERRESHDIKRGDIMRVPAGVIVYAINKASNERLRVAMLLHPISTPGQIEVDWIQCTPLD